MKSTLKEAARRASIRARIHLALLAGLYGKSLDDLKAESPGFREDQLDQQGNLVRSIERDPGSDTTRYIAYEKDGTHDSWSETVFRDENGRKVVRKNMPAVYQFTPA